MRFAAVVTILTAVVCLSVAHCFDACQGGLVRAQAETPVVSAGCAAASPPFTLDSADTFDPCCRNHNACYSVCGASRLDCDRALKRCLLMVCKTSQEKKKCNKAVTPQLQAQLSESRFDAEQDARCDCVPPNHVPQRYLKHCEGIIERATKKGEVRDKKLVALRQSLLDIDGTDSARFAGLFLKVLKENVRGIEQPPSPHEDL